MVMRMSPPCAISTAPLTRISSFFGCQALFRYAVPDLLPFLSDTDMSANDLFAHARNKMDDLRDAKE